MRYPRALLAIVLTGAIGAGLLPASTSFAAADETSAAREHAQKGKAFMDLGKYNEAAAEYEAAYAEKQDPTLLLNLAQAYRMAGNGNKAVFFYRKYLQHVPKSPYRADIEDKIATLEKGGATGSVAPPPAGENPITPPPPPTVPPASRRSSAGTDDGRPGSEPTGPTWCAAGQPGRRAPPCSTRAGRHHTRAAAGPAARRRRPSTTARTCASPGW